MQILINMFVWNIKSKDEMTSVPLSETSENTVIVAIIITSTPEKCNYFDTKIEYIIENVANWMKYGFIFD